MHKVFKKVANKIEIRSTIVCNETYYIIAFTLFVKYYIIYISNNVNISLILVLIFILRFYFSMCRREQQEQQWYT